MATTNRQHRVAVYGSLRRGLGNHTVISSGEFVKQTTLTDKQIMVSLYGFPGVCRDSSLDYKSVTVELYDVDDDTFFDLDCLESNGSFYTREEVELDSGDTAWVYFLPYHEYKDNPPVDSGDWVKYLEG